MADVVSNSDPMVTGPGTSFLEGLAQPSQIANTQANTAVQQAQIPLLGAQATGADLQNQQTKMFLDALTGAGGASGGGASGAGVAPSASPQPNPVGATGVDAADITQHAFDKFAPVPTALPPQLAARAAYLNALKPGSGDALIIAPYKAQVDGVNQTRALGANNTYQGSVAVANAPPGTAFATLQRSHPD